MNSIFEKIKSIGIVPVIKIDDAEKAVPLAKALIEGGLPCAEITYRTKAGEDAIRRIKNSDAADKILLGAGTVLTAAQVDSAIAAGAAFIVSPGFNPKVVAYCIQKNIPIVPGCSNPSDMEAAIEMGLEVVKFFPAEQSGGLAYIKAVAAPYPNLKFMPTGGINAKNVSSYLSFDKVIACGGSWMTASDLINGGKFDEITRLCKEAATLVKGASVTEKKPAEKTASSGGISNEAGGKKVVCFGELMLRLAPEGYYRFVQAQTLGATFGGGEANVAVSLCNYGIDAAFVTKLPKHEIGQAAVNSLRQFGVDTSKIVRGGERVGIYYLEKGASQRPSKVIYDRAYSAIAKAEEGDFNWDEIFKNVSWFHFTGITPALGANVAAICEQACKAARAKNITVSCDLNYRKNLWTREEACKVMSNLVQYVDVCIANEEDASDVFGIHAASSDVTSGKINTKGYEEVAKKLSSRFGFKKVAITLRESISANDNNWAAMLFDTKEGKYYFSKKYPVHIVDRVGGGDSFGAGLIYANLTGMQAQDEIEFAVAASCLKHSIEGDFNQVSVDEVQKLICGDGSGRVQR